MVSVVDQTPISRHVANGAAKQFPFEFELDDPSDLIVLVAGASADGYALKLTPGSGGSVNFLTPPASGSDVIIRRYTKLRRDTDYQVNGDIREATLDRDFNRLWLALQDQHYNQSEALSSLSKNFKGIYDAIARMAKVWSAPQEIGDPMWMAVSAVLAGNGPATQASVTNLSTVAIIAAINAANRTAVGTVKDLTPPPKALGLTGRGGITTIYLSWAAASYTQGHGHASAIVYGAPWSASGAPTQPVPLWYGSGSNAQIAVDPGSLWRFWVSWVSYDGIEGPLSSAFDMQAMLVGSASVATDLLEAKQLSADIETGLLINDPSFAAGSAGWPGFVSRVLSVDSAAPVGSPSKWATRFTGRVCASARKLRVIPGESYRLSVFCNPLNAGVAVGVCIVTNVGDVVTSALSNLAPNTWGRAKHGWTVPDGVYEIAVGPFIDQAPNGTSECLFAEIRVEKVVPLDLAVEGTVIADSMAAQNIAAFQAVLGNLRVDAATVTGRLTAAELVVGSVSLQQEIAMQGRNRVSPAGEDRQVIENQSQVFSCSAGSRLMINIDVDHSLQCGAMRDHTTKGPMTATHATVKTIYNIFVNGQLSKSPSSIANSELLIPWTLNGVQQKNFFRSTSRTMNITLPVQVPAGQTGHSMQIHVVKEVTIFNAAGNVLEPSDSVNTSMSLVCSGIVHENKV